MSPQKRLDGLDLDPRASEPRTWEPTRAHTHAGLVHGWGHWRVCKRCSNGPALIRAFSRPTQLPVLFWRRERGTDVPLNCCTIPPARTSARTSARSQDIVQSPLVWAWVVLAGKLDHSLALSGPHPLTLGHPYPRPPYCCLLSPLLTKQKRPPTAGPNPSPAHPPVPHHDYPPKRRNCSSYHSAPHPLPSHQLLQTDKPCP